MSIKDLVKTNGDNSRLSTQREENYGLPSLQQEMQQWMSQWDRLFEGFFGRAYGLTPFRGNELGWGSSGNAWDGFVPAVNVTETDNEYRVTAELPGMDQNDVELSIHNGSLTIKGEKKKETEEKKEGFYRMERSYGTFHRTLPLPQEVDAEHVEATFKKGVLTVTLPKLPELQSGAKKIAIKTEEPGK